MHEYLKTKLPALISVQSVVTVFHKIFRQHFSSGEAHDFPELVYVSKGPHNVQIDGVTYEMEAGQFILYAPLAFHKNARPSDATVDIISFESDAPQLHSLYNRIITLSPHQRMLLSEIITAGVEIFESNREVNGIVGMAPKDGTDMYELQKLKNQLELLLIDIFHTEASAQDRTTAVNHTNYSTEQFEALTAYLKAHLHEPLTLERISADCVMSVSKLKRLCAARCGMAPINYLISLRIEEAKRMIRESSMNLTQIAEALGFGSLHFFSRQFKQKTGITPSEYAKSVCKR